MKNFMRFSMIAVAIVLVAVMASMFVAPAAAATPEGPTIYISDDGEGNGSSKNSPLKAEERVKRDAAEGTEAYIYYYAVNASGGSDSTKRFYQNSVLYQAAEMLAETGGKIVLVGDVTIDFSKTYAGKRKNARDFYMPEHGDNEITITSDGGRLILTEGAYLGLGGKTKFENITIATKTTNLASGDQVDKNLAICCSGYETVFGAGVNCVNLSGKTSAEYFLSILGGPRFSANWSGDTNITIESGTWNRVYGGLYGNSGDTHHGDVEINIYGGTYKSHIIGGGREYNNGNGNYHDGDVEINIFDGTFGGNIYAASGCGKIYSGNKAFINICGGKFTATSPKIDKIISPYPNPGAITPNVTVNLSAWNTTMIPTVTADTVYYPATMVTSASIMSQPTNEICYVGESYKADDMVIAVTYENNETARITYSPDDTCFAFSCDNSKTGTTTVSGTYGGCGIGLNKSITVFESPRPTIKGAQIHPTEYNSGLRFVAQVSKSANSVIKNPKYGFVIWDTEKLSVTTAEDIEKIYGTNKIAGESFRENDTLYNNNRLASFCAIYDNIQLNSYNSEIAAIAYIEYEYNNKTYVDFSEIKTRSVNYVANEAIKHPYEDIDNIKKNVIDRYEAYLNSTYVPNEDEVVKAKTIREKVIGIINNIAEYSWRPSSVINLSENIELDGKYYTGGTYNNTESYTGMPYVSNGKATFEEFTSYMSKTLKEKYGKNVYVGFTQGIKDFALATVDKDAISTEQDNVQKNLSKIDEKYHEIETFFPACDDIGMIVNIWNKVGTNKPHLTDIASFIENTELVYIADFNDCQAGDVIVNTSSSAVPGERIYMVMGAPVSGTLTLKTFKPDMTNKTHFADVTMSIEELEKGTYSAVTLPELATSLETKTVTYVTGFDGEKAMKHGILSGIVTSNKQIISVNVKLSRKENAGELFDETVYCNSVLNQNVEVFNLNCFNMSDIIPYLCDGKEYTLTVTVNVAGEEKTLVSYKYTPETDLNTKYVYYLDSAKLSEKLESLGLEKLSYKDMQQKAVSHMVKQMNMFWTPSTTFKMGDNINPGTFVPSTLYEESKLYRGILYSDARSTYREFEQKLNELDSTHTGKVTVEGKTYDIYNIGIPTLEKDIVSGTTLTYVDCGETRYNWEYVLGNHCSSAMYNGYQQAIRLHANSRSNKDMYLVGLPTDLYYNVRSWTYTVTQLYGLEAMYESYAQAKPGDMEYHTAGGGHTRMVRSEPKVVRDANGKIDPKNSYLYVIEQTDTLEPFTDDNGNAYWSTWWESKYSFHNLANAKASAIILRPTEYETNETEEHYIGITKMASPSLLNSPSKYNMGLVESNYPILGVKVSVSNGTTSTYAEDRALTGTNSYNIGTLVAKMDKNFWSASGNYTYKLEVELAIGSFVVDEQHFSK